MRVEFTSETLEVIAQFKSELGAFQGWVASEMDSDPIGYEVPECLAVLGKVEYILSTDVVDAHETLRAWLYSPTAAGTPELPEGYTGDLLRAVEALDQALYYIT